MLHWHIIHLIKLLRLWIHNSLRIILIKMWTCPLFWIHICLNGYLLLLLSPTSIRRLCNLRYLLSVALISMLLLNMRILLLLSYWLIESLRWLLLDLLRLLWLWYIWIKFIYNRFSFELLFIFLFRRCARCS